MSEKVLAAVRTGASKTEIRDYPMPDIPEDAALMKMEVAGICGTDSHATQGLFPWPPPLVLGHEYTGVVREVGKGVAKSLIGKAVACEPSYGCGKCAECTAQRVSQCPGATRVGGFSERVALPLACVHPLPKGLDPVTAALTEPAACCLSGLEQFRMPTDATVLVIGGGIMGLLTMALAKRRGARRLILSDPLDDSQAPTPGSGEYVKGKEAAVEAFVLHKV